MIITTILLWHAMMRGKSAGLQVVEVSPLHGIGMTRALGVGLTANGLRWKLKMMVCANWLFCRCMSSARCNHARPHKEDTFCKRHNLRTPCQWMSVCKIGEVFDICPRIKEGGCVEVDIEEEGKEDDLSRVAPLSGEGE